MEFITVDGEMGALDRIHDLGLLILLIVCRTLTFLSTRVTDS